MEAYVTPPDPNSISDPLTRLLAAILAFLRALLAEHQASLRPSAPIRHIFSQKSANFGLMCDHADTIALARAPASASETPAVHPRAARLRDATALLTRPRLVAPS